MQSAKLMLADVKEVFDLFDFWDGRDGLVDGAKIGDLIRCCGLNPTQAIVLKNGGTKKFGLYCATNWIRLGPLSFFKNNLLTLFLLFQFNTSHNNYLTSVYYQLSIALKLSCL